MAARSEAKEWVTRCLTDAHWSIPMVNAILARDNKGIAKALSTLPTGELCTSTSKTCFLVYPSAEQAKQGSGAVLTIEIGKVLGKGVYGEVSLIEAKDQSNVKTTLVVKKWLSNESIPAFFRELIIAAIVHCVNPAAMPKIHFPLILRQSGTADFASVAVMDRMDGIIYSLLDARYYGDPAKPERWLTLIVTMWRTLYNLQGVLQFEHRDLHVANIMYRPIEAKTIRITPCFVTKVKTVTLRHGLDCIENVDIEMPGDGLEYRLIDTGAAVIVFPTTDYRFAAGGIYEDLTWQMGRYGDLPYLAMNMMWAGRFKDEKFPAVGSNGWPEDPTFRMTIELYFFLLHVADGLWLPWGNEPANLSWQTRIWYRIAARQEMYPDLDWGTPHHGLLAISRYLGVAKEKKRTSLSPSELQEVFPSGRAWPLPFPNSKAATATEFANLIMSRYLNTPTTPEAPKTETPKAEAPKAETKRSRYTRGTKKSEWDSFFKRLQSKATDQPMCGAHTITPRKGSQKVIRTGYRPTWHFTSALPLTSRRVTSGRARQETKEITPVRRSKRLMEKKQRVTKK